MTKTFRNLSGSSGGRSFANTSYAYGSTGNAANLFNGGTWSGGTWNGGTWNNVTIDTAFFRNAIIFYGTNSSNSISFNGQTNLFNIDLPTVNFGASTKVFYGPNNYITSNADNQLCLFGTTGISLLTGSGSITVPHDCQIEYGNAQQYIRGNSANQLVIGAPQISIAGDIDIPFPYSMTFGSKGTYMRTSNLASDTLVLSAPILAFHATGQINIPTKIPLKFGRASIVEEKGVLSITSDVIKIAGESLLKFDRGETIVSGNNGLIVSTPAFTITGDLYTKGQIIAVDTINLMVDDPVVIVGEGSHSDNFDRGVAFTVADNSYGFFGYKSDTDRFVFYTNTNSSFVQNYFPRGTTGMLECSGLYNQQVLKIDTPEVVFLSSTIYLNEALTVGITANSDATLTCTAKAIKVNNTLMSALDDGTLSLSGDLNLGGAKLSCPNNIMIMGGIKELNLPVINTVVLGSGAVRMTSIPNGIRISPSLQVGGSITAGVWQGSPISPEYGGMGQAFTIDGAIPVFSKAIGVFQQSMDFTYNSTSGTLVMGNNAVTLSPIGLKFSATNFSLGTLSLRGPSINWSNSDFITSPSLGTVTLQAGSTIRLNAVNGIDTTQPTLKIQKTMSINDNAWIQWSSTSIQNVLDSLVFTAKTLSLNCTDHVEIADKNAITWGDTMNIGFRGNMQSGVLSLMATNAIAVPTSVPFSFTNSTSQIVNQPTELQVLGQSTVRIKAPLIILDGQMQMTGQTSTIQTRTLTIDGSIVKIGDTSLSYDTGKDLGLQLQRYGGSSFMLWQNSTKRFVFASNGTDDDKNDIIEVNALADVQADRILVNSIPGFALTGNMTAGSSLISGSNFHISGGTVDNWATSTTSVITNLNSDYVRGKTVKDFVLRDGSQALINDWKAGCGISAKWLAFDDSRSDAMLTRDATGKIATTGLAYDAVRNVMSGNVDVSSSMLTLRDGQIDGSKVTGHSKDLSIGGNANSVTNGIYTTTYNSAYGLLVANVRATPQVCTLPQNSVLGRAMGDVTALSPKELCDIVASGDNGVRGWEQITNAAPTLQKGTSFIRITEKTIVSLPDGLPGQTVTIVVVVAPEATLALNLNLTTPDGFTGLKTLIFDKTGMSINLCYFPNLSWVIVNSGALCNG